MQKIINNSKKYYEDKFKKFGPSVKGLNWKNKSSQELRFKILTKIGNINNRSVHDFGCGYGDFNKYLKKDFINFKYIGTDISELILKEAKKKNRQNSIFYKYDIINSSFEKKLVSDFVLNSGVFTVRNNINNDKWWGFVKSGIKSMYKYSKIGIGFNLMSSAVDFKERHLFYKSSKDVSKFIQNNLSKKIKIVYSQYLWEYTVFVYK